MPLHDELGPTPARSCGDCDACCSFLDVRPLRKPSGYRCPHQSGSGCAIYEDRPRICRGFACNWSMGDPAVPPGARPDVSGLLVFIEDTAAGLTVQVRELHPGALADGWIRSAMAKWRTRITVAVEHADGRRRFALPGRSWQWMGPELPPFEG